MLEVAHALVATSNAPLDWVYGTAAAALFVGAIVVPAAVLNSRDHRRFHAQQASRAPAAAPGQAGTAEDS